MNLFELSALLSSIGGAVGGANAVLRTASSTPMWMWFAIPLGFVCGIGCYFGLTWFAVGRYAKTSDNLPAWRGGVLLLGAFVAPYVAAWLAFLLVRAILYVAT